MFLVQSLRPDGGGIYLGSLDNSDSTRLLDVSAPFAYSASGHLLFVRNRALLAQAFDTTSGRMAGEADVLPIRWRGAPVATPSPGRVPCAAPPPRRRRA